MPGLGQLPAWTWRRLGRPGRIAAGVALLAAIGVAAALVPGIRESKQERAQAERRERVQQREALVRRLEAEQRPRSGRSGSVAPAGVDAQRRRSARAGLMNDLSAAIVADARARVRRGELDGPIRRLDCDPYPRSVDGVGADRDLSRRRGRYACIAVTAEFGRGEAGTGGVLGHQYRVLVDFESGRYGYCKVSGQAGPAREQLVTTPRACGGT